MHKVKYALFYDFHTSPVHPGVGSKFDADKITDRFLECGVDYVTFHARCNMGMAYYDTKIGIKHPSLERDIFGELATACSRKGIALGAYFNAGISRAEAVAHRDWATLYFGGQTYREPFEGPFSMTMCYNSPYRAHLIDMALEVARKYDVKGFFFDCMAPFPCVCPECVRLMHEQKIDIRSIDGVRAFSGSSAARLAGDLADVLAKVNPEYLIYFNDLPFEAQKNSGSYLEFECLPCRSGGYEYMHTMPHYMRTLGKPCIHMTGRFNKWADFGGLRSENAIKYELLFALANGLRPNIGDHLLPDGSVSEPVFGLIGKVYKELQKYEDWFDSSKPEAEIAIVYPKEKLKIGHDPEILGVIRMLTELKYQFDIVTLAVSWDKYSVLIFPDSVEFDGEISDHVRKHLSEGKKIVASARSGLNPENRFPEEWGIKYKGVCPFTPAYFVSAGHCMDVPDMPLSVYADGLEVLPDENTEICGNLVKPAVNSGWDGLYPQYYNPPYEKTALPFLTFTGQVAYFSHRIFSAYHLKAPVQLKRVLSSVLKKVLPDPFLKIENAPSFLQAFVTTQCHRINVHFLAYIPEKRGSDAEIIEDSITIPEFEFELKTDSFTPCTVYVAPGREKLDFVPGAYTKIKVPQFSGYALVCLEKG